MCIICSFSVTACFGNIEHYEALQIANDRVCSRYKAFFSDCSLIEHSQSSTLKNGTFSFSYILQEEPLLEALVHVGRMGSVEMFVMDER